LLPALTTDISSLLQNLAASKQALQQQLEHQKKEQQQALLFKKTIKQHKLHQQVKKEPSTPLRETKEKELPSKTDKKERH